MDMNKEYINSYEDYLKIDKKYSKNTLLSYMNDINKFNEYIKNKDFKKIEKKDVISYLDNERKKGMKDRTLSHNLIVIKNFYKYLYQ